MICLWRPFFSVMLCLLINLLLVNRQNVIALNMARVSVVGADFGEWRLSHFETSLIMLDIEIILEDEFFFNTLDLINGDTSSRHDNIIMRLSRDSFTLDVYLLHFTCWKQEVEYVGEKWDMVFYFFRILPILWFTEVLMRQ